jgi:Ca2+-binding RTX toxin-like protein
MAFVVNLADLTRILSDIQIAEAHAAGTPLTDQINSPLLPFGLRTVDGTYNNLLPGQENWGAADQTMPRLLDPDYRDDQDGDTMPLGPGMTVTNTDYGAAGHVADADPRIISNLIVDQSINNPAAVISALSALGSADPYGDAQIFLDAQAAAQAAQDALPAAQAAADAAAAALVDAQANAGAANGQASADAAAAAAAQATADGLAADAAATLLALTAAQSALTDGQSAAAAASQTEADAHAAHTAAVAATASAAAQLTTAQSTQSAALAAFGAAAAAAAAAADAADDEQAAYDALLAEIPDPQTILDQQGVVDAADQAAAAAAATAQAAADASAASDAAEADALIALNAAQSDESDAQAALDDAVLLQSLADANVIAEAGQLATAQDAFDTATSNASAAAVALASAVTAQADAVAAHDPFQLAINQAQSNLASAEGDVALASQALADAQLVDDAADALVLTRTTEQADAQAVYDDLVNNQGSPEPQTGTALGNLNTASAALQDAMDAAVLTQTDLDAAVIAESAAQDALAAAQTALDDAVADGAVTQAALDGANADLFTAQGNDSAAQTALADAQTALDGAQTEYNNALAAASAAATAVANAQDDLTTAQAALVGAQAQYDTNVGLAVAAAAAAAQAADDAAAADATAAAELAELAAIIDSTPSAEALGAQLALLTTANDAAAAAQAASAAALVVFSAAVQAATVAQQALTSAQAVEASALSALESATAASDAAAAALPGLADAVTAAQTASDDAQTAAADAQATADALALTASESQADADAAAGTLADAQAAADAATLALGEASAAVADTQATLDGVPAAIGLEFDINDLSVMIPNVAPDEGLSAPVNGWMTLFGQFFDHGLDLIPKANNGTVFIPLQPDDPLYVPGGHTNFMVVTRADVDANGEVINLTTPFVDQNQTYTSHPSHQVFLREYDMIGGEPMNTGRLLEGSAGGPATWADVKAQARDLLGIDLTDIDVLNVPLLATDPYGNFIRGANGLPQVVMDNGAGGTVLVEGVLGAPIDLTNAVRTGHAFLDDIAHNAAPGAGEVADADSDISTAGQQQPAGTYDNELLDRHFITGDGRGNENIGLTTVHHVFHSEHNRLVEEYKHTILDSGDLAFINEWLLEPALTLPTDVDTVVWNGERLFQAGRWVTEMQYQHLVFEEFGRTIQPNIDAFVFSNTADINPAIFAEFAHVVYRFGHSMLTEEVHRLDGAMVDNDIGLIEAFLNPVAFTELNGGTVSAEEGAGAVVRAMTRVAANELDEFTTEALRNNLVGLPLDLAAINIARARETGVPSLNEARRQFHEMTGGDTLLRPYTSWADFAQNIKNPASIVNFIAAYGTHTTITSAVTAADKRAAAMDLVFGTGGENTADRLDFLNAEGAYAGGSLGGLNEVDFWIGGLAEEIMPFGGMLGSTFNFVFEAQMQNLQDGDRFYYLSRTQGMNILNQLEANSFAALIMRNTDLGDGTSSHLPGHVFATPAYTFEIDQSLEAAGQVDPVLEDPYLGALTELVVRADNFLQYTGGDHVVLGGTNDANTLIGGDGDDTLWGDGGNDRLEGGFGVDMVMGGDGDDIITDAGDIDMLKGGAGNDVIHAGNGLGDLVFGESGSDFLIGGVDSKEIFAGEGNDFVLGSEGASLNLGNEGDDWLEGGMGFDTLAGENSELFFNSPIIGHDVLDGKGNDTDYDGESGDDIMFQNAGIQRNNGMAGFDWTIHKGDINGADSDLGIPIFVNQQAVILRDRFDLVEGLSGWVHDDNLIGREIVTGANGAAGAAAEFDANDKLESFSNALLQSSVNRIDGFDQLVAHLGRVDWTWAGETHSVVVMDEAAVQRDSNDVVTFIDDTAADILLGGGGSDTMMGKDGNDIIDGDRWLNVRIAVSGVDGFPGATADGLTSAVYTDATMSTALFDGRPLHSLMLDRTLTTNQLSIVREILDGDAGNTGVDTAVFRDQLINYSITLNEDGSLSVQHLQPLQVDGAGGGNDIFDGTDRLINVEMLRFSDGAGGTVDFSVAELFNANPEIISDGGNDIGFVFVAENTTAVTTVFALDADEGPQAIVYSITGGADASLFSINAETGELVFNAAPDFELLPSALFEVIVQASDGFEVDTQTLTVEVTNEDEAHTGSVNIVNAVGLAAAAQLTAVSTVFDQDGMLNANLTQWQQLVGGNWINLTGATDNLLTAADGTFRVTSQYVDAFSSKMVISEQTAFVVGSASSNTVVGTSGSDYMLGLFGADVLTGGAGNDTVLGHVGNDRFVATVGDGDDRYVGGFGVDTYDLSQTSAAATVDLLAGTASSSQTGNDILSGIENVIGSAGSNTIIGDGQDNALSGGGGNDTISGGTGADTLVGNAGDDHLMASVDNVRDVLNGAANVDTADYSAYTANLSVALNGATTVVVTGSGTTAASSDTLQNIENFIGGDGNDSISGNTGVNNLQGGSGNDTLTGGNGADVLTGGAGADRFVLTAAGQSTAVSRDVITDFTQGTDRIDLSGIDANFSIASLLTDQAFNVLLSPQPGGAAAAFTGVQQLRYFYDVTNNLTILEGNANNNTAADFQIALVGQHSLQLTDFVL